MCKTSITVFSLCKSGDGLFMACANKGVFTLVLSFEMIVNLNITQYILNQLNAFYNIQYSDKLLSTFDFIYFNYVGNFCSKGIQ